jgi:hypothetical protein
MTSVINGLETRRLYQRRGLRQGCSLSPLLFAIYILALGKLIDASRLGVLLSGKVISGLFIADDLLLLALTAEGLLFLLRLVKQCCDELKMEISCDKSQVISPSDIEWSLLNSEGGVAMSLKSVLQYKYLGIETFGSMFKTGTFKQSQAISTAHKYKGACLKVSRLGPDMVALARACWENIAIPAFLFGTESIPFSESTIQELERTQAQVAKSLLGLRLCSVNVSAQVDMGFKSVRHHLYLRQLKYFLRVQQLPEHRWAHLAYLEHRDGGWNSPYLHYILRLRTETELLVLPPTAAHLTYSLNTHFLKLTNEEISAHCLPLVGRLTSFSPARHLSEKTESCEISRWKFGCAELGHRVPRVGYHRKRFCPLCPLLYRPLNEAHMFVCPALEVIRDQSIISPFIGLCFLNGFSIEKTLFLYVNGKDTKGCDIPLDEFLDRGKALLGVVAFYLAQW